MVKNVRNCKKCLKYQILVPVTFWTIHIVPFQKFHRIGGAPPETFHNVKYDAPEEVGGERKCY